MKKWVRCTRGSTPCFKTEKLKNWKTEKFANPLEQGLTLHTKAYRRWYLSATTHCEYLTKRILSVHITEIVRATNSVLYRTEMNIYELNELDSSVRSNAIGGFRLKWLFFQKHPHKSREVKLSATSSSSTGTTIKVQVCKHLEHWSLKMVLLYNDKTAVDVPDCKMMKIWLSQNFLIGTAPRSLDKRHGQVRKCWRNLTSYSRRPWIWRHKTPSAGEKVSPLYTWSTPCFKTEKL